MLWVKAGRQRVSSLMDIIVSCHGCICYVLSYFAVANPHWLFVSLVVWFQNHVLFEIFHDPTVCASLLVTAKTCLCCFRFKFFKLLRQIRTDLVRLFHLHCKAQNLESRKFMERDKRMSSGNWHVISWIYFAPTTSIPPKKRLWNFARLTIPWFSGTCWKAIPCFLSKLRRVSSICALGL